MKRIIVCLLGILPLVTIAQGKIKCDLKAKYEGEMTSGSNSLSPIKITSSTMPQVGESGDLYKYFESSLFGGRMTGTMSIAEVKVEKVSGNTAYLRVLKETSNITINGKKKDQFVTGNKVQLKIHEFEEPTLTTKKWPSGKKKSSGYMACGKRMGAWKYYDENGVLLEEYELKDGKKEGDYKSFHPNGKVKAQGIYERDKKKGLWKEFHDNGALFKEETYKYGDARGPYKTFHPNGKLASEGTMGFNGRAEGVEKHYHENGKLKSYFNPDTDSILEYHDNGQLAKQGVYDDFFKRYEGPLKEFHANGKPKSITNYSSSGKIEGKYTEWYDNGQVKVEGEYKWTGDKDKTWKEYTREGKLLKEEQYEYGKLRGVAKEYYPNGNPKSMVSYSNGKQNGVCTYFHENGQKKSAGWLTDGKKNKNWLTFAEDGSIKTKTAYYNDEVNGEVVIYHSKDVIKEKYFEKNGVKYGAYVLNDPEGKPQIVANYNEAGALDGAYEKYDDSGKLVEKGMYISGKKSGKWLEYVNGKKKKVKY